MDNQQKPRTEEFAINGEELLSRLRQLLQEGNVRRVSFRNEEGKTLLARCTPTILPNMVIGEMLEITNILWLIQYPSRSAAFLSSFGFCNTTPMLMSHSTPPAYTTPATRESCGKPLTKQQKRFCSRACYFASGPVALQRNYPTVEYKGITYHLQTSGYYLCSKPYSILHHVKCDRPARSRGLCTPHYKLLNIEERGGRKVAAARANARAKGQLQKESTAEGTGT